MNEKASIDENIDTKEADKATKEKAKREIQEVKQAKQAEVKARKEALKRVKQAEAKARREEKVTKEEAKREAQETKKKVEISELYEGLITLAIIPPTDLEQMKKLEDYLRQVKDLRFILAGGTIDGDTKIVVSANKPLSMLHLLNKIPPVEQATDDGKGIQIKLKASS